MWLQFVIPVEQILSLMHIAAAGKVGWFLALIDTLLSHTSSSNSYFCTLRYGSSSQLELVGVSVEFVLQCSECGSRKLSLVYMCWTSCQHTFSCHFTKSTVTFFSNSISPLGTYWESAILVSALWGVWRLLLVHFACEVGNVIIFLLAWCSGSHVVLWVLLVRLLASS